MNDNDKVLRHDKTCDASRMHRRDDDNERMRRKTNN